MRMYANDVRISNIILFVGVCLVVLRLFFPVLQCSAVHVVRFCPEGRILNFAVRAPTAKEHIPFPKFSDVYEVTLWNLQEVARLRGEIFSPYVIDSSRTYA